MARIYKSWWEQGSMSVFCCIHKLYNLLKVIKNASNSLTLMLLMPQYATLWSELKVNISVVMNDVMPIWRGSYNTAVDYNKIMDRWCSCATQSYLIDVALKYGSEAWLCHFVKSLFPRHCLSYRLFLCLLQPHVMWEGLHMEETTQGQESRMYKLRRGEWMSSFRFLS